MSAILYKDGVAHKINPYRVPQHLKAGYTTQPILDVAREETQSTELSLPELRELAQEEGIDGWETKHAKTLKKDLGIE